MTEQLPEKTLRKLQELKHRYYVYDNETYPNIFTFAVENALDPNGKRIFEISTRQNDVRLLVRTLHWFAKEGFKMVGFNNMGFDYPIIHYLLTNLDPNIDGATLARSLYDKANSLIHSSNDQSFRNVIWPNDQIIKQVDLYKIHHFDNKAKATGLKMLEFNMRSANIKDLPYVPGTILTYDEMDELKRYNQHDVSETAKFFRHSLDQVSFREKLSSQYDRDMMCDNDMRIGKNYFISELERRLGRNICFEYVNGQRVPRQTIRESINIGEIIFPCVKFNSNAFNSVKAWLSSQVIYETKGVFTDIPYLSLKNEGNYYHEQSNTPRSRGGRRIIMYDHSTKSNITDFMNQIELQKKLKINGEDKTLIENLHCYYHGFRFDFGTGGLHGCAEPKTFSGRKVRRIADVASYYPSIVVHNRLFPAHLGEEFADIYNEIKEMRFSYPKGSPENAMLKLALNAAGFGDTNNAFSPFYDPQMTMTITINGQLMLCMLAERLIDSIPDIEIIQVNTDGVDVTYDEIHESKYRDVCNQWQEDTGMVLEYFDAHAVYQRDVNNYISVLSREYTSDFSVKAEFEYGSKIKRKGAYSYNLDWHQNHSSLVVQKAAEAALIHGEDVRRFIENHDDDYDFMLRTKVPRSSKLLGLVDLVEGMDLPIWYKRLAMTDRYALEQVGIENIAMIHNEMVKQDTRANRYSEFAEMLDISSKQFEAGVNWLHDETVQGRRLPVTVRSEKMQNITRYFISTDGVELKKVMPPLRNKPGHRYLSVNTGYLVTDCNDVINFDRDKINYDWYVNEAMKLVSPVRPKPVRPKRVRTI